MGIQINGQTDRISAVDGSFSIQDLAEVNVTGVATASNFKSGTSNVHSTGYECTNINATGIVTAASANFTGNVSVGGTLTYQDVTNIDSVGVITARQGIDTDTVRGKTNNSNLAIGARASNGAFVQTITIKPDRSVGLGNITNPTSILDVRQTNTGAATEIKLFNLDQSNATTQTAALVMTPDVRANGVKIVAVKEVADMSSSANKDLALTFQTVANNTAEERLRIDSAGNIGIDCTPNDHNNFTRALDVNGPSGAAVYMRTNDSTSNCFIVGNYGSEAYINNVANGNIRFFTQGVEKLRLTNTGLVGVNCTPLAQFQVKAGTNQNIALSSMSSEAAIEAFNDAGSANVSLRLRGSDLKLFTGSTERLRINSDGKVLIGSDTGSVHGDRLLQVGKTDRSSTYISITSSTSGTGGLLFADTTTNDTGGYRGIIDYTHSNDAMRFFTQATERFSITSNGGLNNGNITISGYQNTHDPDNYSFFVSDNHANTFFGQNLRLGHNGSTGNHQLLVNNQHGSIGGAGMLIGGNQSSYTNQLKFFTVPANQPAGTRVDNTAYARMTIGSDGRCYYGTTSQGPHGGFFNIDASSSGGNGMNVKGTTANYAYISSAGGSSGDHIHFSNYSNSNQETGRIKDNQSNVTYYTSSDYRLKDNIVSITDGITRVKQLNPVRHTWINNPALGTVDGWIAHELDEVCPDAVDGEKDAVREDGSIKAQAADYGRITPLLAAALKELIAKVETLEAAVTALQGS